MDDRLTNLEPGQAIVFGGDRVTHVSPEMAADFREGDRLIVVQETGDLLHVPASEWGVAGEAVSAAVEAFSALGTVADDQITAFFESFAERLEDDDIFGPIAVANGADVEAARARGRSTTRLVLSEPMRLAMIEGLRLWAKTDGGRGSVVESIAHEGWSVEQTRAGLGVIGFVFEGRPNVVADATGVLRSGNAVVFRIGSDALGTARAIVESAVAPSLAASGLPAGAVSLVDSRSHAAGWALFADRRLGLAVARGSGPAVAQLGAVARQAGTPVSLHGTGGAWLVAAGSAPQADFAAAVHNSLDRKVCNTVNTVCIVEERAQDLVPVFLDALDRAAGRRKAAAKLHVVESDRDLIPPSWFEPVEITRAAGGVVEPKAEVIGRDLLGHEWEWEESPEVTLVIVEDVAEAVALFNEQSPHFIASLISTDEGEHQRFFDTVDAPFVGNGFTRWVDGQYALDRPELGLSNWQFGRLFMRGGVLSGDSAYTIRTRVRQTDPDIGR